MATHTVSTTQVKDTLQGGVQHSPIGCVSPATDSVAVVTAPVTPLVVPVVGRAAVAAAAAAAAIAAAAIAAEAVIARAAAGKVAVVADSAVAAAAAMAGATAIAGAAGAEAVERGLVSGFITDTHGDPRYLPSPINFVTRCANSHTHAHANKLQTHTPSNLSLSLTLRSNLLSTDQSIIAPDVLYVTTPNDRARLMVEFASFPTGLVSPSEGLAIDLGILTICPCLWLGLLVGIGFVPYLVSYMCCCASWRSISLLWTWPIDSTNCIPTTIYCVLHC